MVEALQYTSGCDSAFLGALYVESGSRSFFMHPVGWLADVAKIHHRADALSCKGFTECPGWVFVMGFHREKVAVFFGSATPQKFAHTGFVGVAPESFFRYFSS